MRTSCRTPRTRRHTLRVSWGKSRDVMTNVKAVRLFILEKMAGYISSDDEELILITAACLALEKQREKKQRRKRECHRMPAR